MAQLEFAVGVLCPVNQLGFPYYSLRALRPFIFRELQQIVAMADSNSNINSSSPQPTTPTSTTAPAPIHEIDNLPPSVILHHLFSRAPSSLLSPHVSVGMSIGQYSEWIDHHNEEEIWTHVIKKALDTYASHINAKGEKEFATIYPILLSLGPKLLDHWRTNSHHSNTSGSSSSSTNTIATNNNSNNNNTNSSNTISVNAPRKPSKG